MNRKAGDPPLCSSLQRTKCVGTTTLKVANARTEECGLDREAKNYVDDKLQAARCRRDFTVRWPPLFFFLIFKLLELSRRATRATEIF